MYLPKLHNFSRTTRSGSRGEFAFARSYELSLLLIVIIIITADRSFFEKVHSTKKSQTCMFAFGFFLFHIHDCSYKLPVLNASLSFNGFSFHSKQIFLCSTILMGLNTPFVIHDVYSYMFLSLSLSLNFCLWMVLASQIIFMYTFSALIYVLRPAQLPKRTSILRPKASISFMQLVQGWIRPMFSVYSSLFEFAMFQLDICCRLFMAKVALSRLSMTSFVPHLR